MFVSLVFSGAENKNKKIAEPKINNNPAKIGKKAEIIIESLCFIKLTSLYFNCDNFV